METQTKVKKYQGMFIGLIYTIALVLAITTVILANSLAHEADIIVLIDKIDCSTLETISPVGLTSETQYRITDKLSNCQ